MFAMVNKKGPLEDALKYQDFLVKNPQLNQTQIASHFGVSKAKITQEMNLLKLNPSIIDYLKKNKDVPKVNKVFTKRKLRPVLKMPVEEQENKFNDLLLTVP